MNIRKVRYTPFKGITDPRVRRVIIERLGESAYPPKEGDFVTLRGSLVRIIRTQVSEGGVPNFLVEGHKPWFCLADFSQIWERTNFIRVESIGEEGRSSFDYYRLLDRGARVGDTVLINNVDDGNIFVRNGDITTVNRVLFPREGVYVNSNRLLAFVKRHQYTVLEPADYKEIVNQYLRNKNSEQEEQELTKEEIGTDQIIDVLTKISKSLARIEQRLAILEEEKQVNGMLFTRNQIHSIKNEVIIYDELKVVRVGNNGDGAIFNVLYLEDGEDRYIRTGNADDVAKYLNRYFNKGGE